MQKARNADVIYTLHKATQTEYTVNQRNRLEEHANKATSRLAPIYRTPFIVCFNRSKSTQKGDRGGKNENGFIKKLLKLVRNCT